MPIPKKFRLLWNQFQKSIVFYGFNSKKVLFLGGNINQMYTLFHYCNLSTYQHDVVKKFLIYFKFQIQCGSMRGVRLNFCL